jgi:glycerophosphoryl diester phosphodiesterase
MALRPYTIAHRGFSGRYPENTLLSFQKAIEVGADWLELDVITTRDDVVIVSHDTTADRCTDGKGSLQEMSLSEVKQLDAGSWFNPSFAGERIPTLDEVLDLVAPLPIRLAIEIKGDTPEQYIHNARAAVSLLKERGYLQKVNITSFDPDSLRAIKTWESSLTTSLDPDKQDGTYSPWELCQQVLACGSNFLQHHYVALNAEIVDEARQHGFGVWAWTVNDLSEMQRLEALGVMGIVTDYPNLISQ